MPNMQNIKLIIGLGNPDEEHQQTYHNVGHLFVDFLQIKDQGSRIKDYLKSNVFMNESGQFVKEAIKKNKIKPNELLITHDDSDIELGKFKFSFGRNSAGHRGIQNIISQLKTKSFWRLRIGIRPSKNREKADELVLKKITPTRIIILEKVFKEAIKKLN